MSATAETGGGFPVPDSPHVKRPIREHYEDRFTVDLDAKYANIELQAVKTWYYLKRVADGVAVHVSSSGRGLHFIAYLEEPMPFHEKVRHRRAAGDDPRRIDMEIKRWHAGLEVDVLFIQKSGKIGQGVQVKEVRTTDVWEALDLIKGRRNDYHRVKQLALDGHKGAPDLAPRWDP